MPLISIRLISGIGKPFFGKICHFSQHARFLNTEIPKYSPPIENDVAQSNNPSPKFYLGVISAAFLSFGVLNIFSEDILQFWLRIQDTNKIFADKDKVVTSNSIEITNDETVMVETGMNTRSSALDNTPKEQNDAILWNEQRKRSDEEENIPTDTQQAEKIGSNIPHETKNQDYSSTINKVDNSSDNKDQDYQENIESEQPPNLEVSCDQLMTNPYRQKSLEKVLSKENELISNMKEDGLKNRIRNLVLQLYILRKYLPILMTEEMDSYNYENLKSVENSLIEEKNILKKELIEKYELWKEDFIKKSRNALQKFQMSFTEKINSIKSECHQIIQGERKLQIQSSKEFSRIYEEMEMMTDILSRYNKIRRINIELYNVELSRYMMKPIMPHLINLRKICGEDAALSHTLDLILLEIDKNDFQTVDTIDNAMEKLSLSLNSTMSTVLVGNEGGLINEIGGKILSFLLLIDHRDITRSINPAGDIPDVLTKKNNVITLSNAKNFIESKDLPAALKELQNLTGRCRSKVLDSSQQAAAAFSIDLMLKFMRYRAGCLEVELIQDIKKL